MDIFDKKVTVSLKEMFDTGADPEEIQAKADELAETYQNTRWLQNTVGDTAYNSRKGERTSSTTGWQQKTPIIIKAFTQKRPDEQPLDAARDGNEDMIIKNNLPFKAVTGATLTISFDPYAIANELIIRIENALGNLEIINTDMIKNETGVDIFEKSILITKETEGTIQYSVRNSESADRDNWKLNIRQDHPVEFNPIPLYRILESSK